MFNQRRTFLCTDVSNKDGCQPHIFNGLTLTNPQKHLVLSPTILDSFLSLFLFLFCFYYLLFCDPVSCNTMNWTVEECYVIERVLVGTRVCQELLHEYVCVYV